MRLRLLASAGGLIIVAVLAGCGATDRSVSSSAGGHKTSGGSSRVAPSGTFTDLRALDQCITAGSDIITVQNSANTTGDPSWSKKATSGGYGDLSVSAASAGAENPSFTIYLMKDVASAQDAVKTAQDPVHIAALTEQALEKGDSYIPLGNVLVATDPNGSIDLGLNDAVLNCVRRLVH